MRPGTLVVPHRVIWRGRDFAADAALGAALGGFSCEALLASDTVVATSQDKAASWRASAADALDMESGTVAEAAQAAGIPFAVLRAVCDPAWRSLPPAALAALDPTGGVGLGQILWSVLNRPSQIGALLSLAADAARARRALVRHLGALRRNGALAPWQ